MSRLFDGVDDQVQWTLTATQNLTGALTFAAILKLDSGVTWQSYHGHDHATTGSEMAMTRFNTSVLGYAVGGGAGGVPRTTGTHSSADGWMLLAMKRTAGAAQTPRFLKYPIGGSPTWENASAGSGTAGNPTTQSGGVIVFGQVDGSDFFKGRLAVVAEWNSALADATVESLVTTMTRANWLSTSPVALWDELDAFQTDHTSNGASRSSITGTADDADDPTGWASWAGAGRRSTWL